MIYRLNLRPDGVPAFLVALVTTFWRNQGLLLAGALAYYALLSLLPLLILSIIGLSQLVNRALLLEVLGRYLDWLLPSVAGPLLDDLAAFLDHRRSIGLVMFGTLAFFSASAFSVLDKAMRVIFAHRAHGKPRHPLFSVLLPYLLAIFLVASLLPLTLGTAALEALSGQKLHLLGHSWSISHFSGYLFSLLGIVLVAFVLAVLYLVVPVGRTRLIHALSGGLAGALIWEALRHGLTWYFSSVSRIGVVYGSLSSAVVLLLCLELGAILLLFGAQLIAELEKRERRADAAT